MNLLPNQLILSEFGTREANGLQNVYGELRGIQSKMVDNALDMRENNSFVAGRTLKSEQCRLFQQLKKSESLSAFRVQGDGKRVALRFG